MDTYQTLNDVLFDFDFLGTERCENGTLLIGRAPHIAELAWLHSIYPTLNKEDINHLEKELNQKIPDSYLRFLTEYSNGLGIFVSKFSLYGLRKQLGRGLDAVRQPYSIITPNTHERPDNAKNSYLFIGGYSWDGSKIYIDTETNKVHYCDRWDATSLYEWSSFEAMLNYEIPRMISLFDKNGVIINDDLYTTPIEREQ